jgi:hypothetical protein
MADNENFGVMKIKNVLRSYYYNLQYLGLNILSVEDGSECIARMLAKSSPFMICRLGAEESRTVQKWMQHRPYSERNVHNIMYNAGVFPNDMESINRFCKVYTEAVGEADSILTWGCVGESELIKKFSTKKVQLMRNETFNILFYDNPWTHALKGKRVLIVHPFVDSIASQYDRRKKLFTKELLPEFLDLVLVKAIQSNAGEFEDLQYQSWFEVLDVMKEEISSRKFDVALIGAGAYGIPLAAHVKSLGKQAIHMAGNLQILFGIRGKRWDKFPQYVQCFNEYWVYPSDIETPKRKGTVEGGSYWK